MFLGDDPRGPSKEIEFTWSGAPLDDESIRALATGLQFSFAWRADNGQLPMMPGTRDPAAQIGDWIGMLHEWWGATDGELPPHVMSWDLMRAAMLARGGATVGYIDHEEAWDMLAHNLELARCYYANWGQYARGYVVGHLYWSSQTDVSSAIDDTARRATSMARCLDTALSLWRRVALHPGEPFHGVDASTSFEPTRR